jgi:hypothetical protein
LSVLRKNGFPCGEEEEAAQAGRVDPVGDLVEIGQFAEADRDQLLALTLWLATSMSSRRDEDVIMADRGPLAWAPVRLSTQHVEFDTCSMKTDVEVHGAFEIISKDGLTRIEKDKNLIGIVNQGRFKLLADECTARRIDLEYLCVSMPEWISHVERHEGGRGFGSHQFWHGLRMALDLDGIIGCCPLVAPSSFPYSSWDGTSADWGYLLRPGRPVYDLL